MLRSLLFDVSPLDPATFAAVAALLLAVGIVASILPAQRAARIDPIRRYDRSEVAEKRRLNSDLSS